MKVLSNKEYEELNDKIKILKLTNNKLEDDIKYYKNSYENIYYMTVDKILMNKYDYVILVKNRKIILYVRGKEEKNLKSINFSYSLVDIPKLEILK